MTDHEIDALDELVRSRGFALLRDYALREHGSETLVARIKQFMKAPGATTPAELIASADAVMALLLWPAEAVKGGRKSHDETVVPLIGRRA